MLVSIVFDAYFVCVWVLRTTVGVWLLLCDGYVGLRLVFIWLFRCFV